MKAVGFLIARPRLAAVIALVILLAGILAAPLLPLTLYPSLARPSITVSCSYPGANAVEVMNTVAGPMEEKMNGVEGMDRMTCSCFDSGSYSLSVTFQVGYDRDVALMKVQSKVQQALSFLPQEVKNTGVTVQGSSSEELGTLTVRSAGGKLTRDQVIDYVHGVINPAILRVPGVGTSSVSEEKLAVRVWMIPERLTALGLNTEDVVSAIKKQNVQASLGSVGVAPGKDPTARAMSLVSKGRLSSPEEFGEIIVATDADGGLVRLKDVATIAMGQQGYTYSTFYEETPAVYVSINLLPGSNPLQTMKEVKDELKRLEPFFPGDLTWDMSYDTTLFMRGALAGTALALALALLIAFVAVWVALRSLRGALVAIAAVSVPLALTALVVLVSGMPVTLLSLYALLPGLALAIGMAGWSLAIVRRGGLPGIEQIAAALVVALAALPIACVDGVKGVLFRQFSLVLAPMAVGATLAALFLVPVVAKRLYAAVAPVPAADGAVKRGFRRGDWFMLIFAALMGLAGIVVYRGLPQAFVPNEDVGVMNIDFKMAEGTPMIATEAAIKRVYREVHKLEGVEKCVTQVGNSMTHGSGENFAKMVIILKDLKERDATTTAHAISRRVQAILDAIPDAESSVLLMPPVRGLGSQGGVCCLIQSIGDNDPLRFSRESLRMRREFQKSPLVETVTGGFYADTPHLRVTIDRPKCELLDVPMSSVFTVLQHNLGSVYINDVNLGTQVNRVTAMSDWSGRARPEDIRRLYARSTTGAIVPVDSLVSCSEEVGPHACYRCNQYVYCTLQFIQKPGVSDSEAIEEVRRICREKLSPGFLNDWANMTYESLKSRGDEGLLIGLSVLLVFLVLVGYRETWRGAVRAILPTVSAVFGALVALWISGVPLSVYSQYAFVLLVALSAAMSLLAGARAGFLARLAAPLLLALMSLPLVFATGYGAVGHASFGVTILGGALGYAFLGVLLQSFISKVSQKGEMK